jgi:hypothetical protein
LILLAPAAGAICSKPVSARLVVARVLCESPLELRHQSRQGFRLLIRGEVTARQPLDLEPEFAQPFLREVDLPMLEGIFVAAAPLGTGTDRDMP